MFPQAVAVSARSSSGLPGDVGTRGHAASRPATVELEIPHDAPEVTARLHALGQVLESKYDGNKAWFRAQIPPYAAHEFARYVVPERARNPGENPRSGRRAPSNVPSACSRGLSSIALGASF